MRVVVLIALVVLACVTLSSSWNAGVSAFASRKETIFVSVASYRDASCSRTIEDLFAKADHPDRVFVGTCEQNADDASESCRVNPRHRDHVRRIIIPHTEARGPTYARYLCSVLYRGEDWYMQIDSHTLFAQGWDTLVLRNAHACQSPKPILTHYPRQIVEMEALASGETSGVPKLCKSKFDDNGVVTFEAVIAEPPSDGKPLGVPFVSGGFVFMPGSAVRDVPFDPDLPNLFQGEEILHSARLWTSGYDFFTPLDNIVFHEYERKDAPKFWHDVDWWPDQKKTLEKVRRLLGLEGPPIEGYPHGMGRERSLAEYWEFAGIDVASREAKSHEKFC